MSGAVFEPLESRVLLSATSPTLDFASYLGGNNFDSARDIAVDANGNIYITGGTRSDNFMTTSGAFDRTHNGPMDAYVIKLDPNGNLIWSTLVGGSGYDRAYGIEVDSQGYVYIAGRAGRNFPVTAGAFQTSFQGYQSGYGEQNAFVAKLTPDGGNLVFATYSGTGEMHRDVAIDQNGDIYVPLSSRHVSSGAQIPMPTHWLTNAYQNTLSGGEDSGIVKIKSDGSDVLWATYYGGSGNESGGGTVRIGPNGDVYLASATTSTDLPTTAGAHDRTHNGLSDWFVARFSSDGSQLISGTYVGGSGTEFPGAHNLEVDAAGNAYLASFTTSTDFPTTAGAAIPNFSGSFVTKIGPTGQLVASTYGAGGGPEGVALDQRGNVYTIGSPNVDGLPITPDAHQPFRQGDKDTFVAQFSTDLTQLFYATYLGGSGDDAARALTADTSGNFYFAGQSSSTNWPTPNGLQTHHGGGTYDPIVAKFAPGIPSNTPPTADAGPDQTIQLSQGQSTVVVTVDGSNSSDPDGPIVTYRWTGTIDPPDVPSFLATLSEGVYTFDLEVKDNDGATATDNITVTILPPTPPPNSPPIAFDDTYDMFENNVLQISATVGVLDNDNDPNGDPVTANLVIGPLDGTLSLAADGSFVYTPNADFHGTDSFTYTAEDATDFSNVATVTITVNPLNDAPDAGDDFYGVDQDDVLRVNALAGVLANDVDVEEDNLTVLLEAGPDDGTLALAADGSFTYTPNAGFNGTDAFTYRAYDGRVAGNLATATITVNPPSNNVPNAGNDLYGIEQDNVLQIQAGAGVLANDSDPDGDPLSALLINDPDDGMLTLAVDGSFVYTPDAGFIGTDSFTYQAHNGLVSSNTATVTITVNSNSTVLQTDFESGLPPGSGTEGYAQTIDDGNGTGNNVLQLTEGADAAFTQLVSLPENVQSLTFDYRFTNVGDGDMIRVSIDGVVLYEQDSAEFVGSQFVSIDSIDLLAFAGQTVQLEFRLSTKGAVNAAVQIDNVSISSADHASLFFQGNSTASYLDANGNVINLSLKGPGTGEIILSPLGLSDAIHIILDGTTDRSTVNLKTNGAITTVGQVTVRNGVLKEFKAPNADLLDGFQSTGTVTKMTWRDVAAGYTRIDVGGNAQSKPARLTFRSVTDLDLKINTSVHEFSATQWLQETVTQNRFESDGARSIKVTGGVGDVTWDILGGAQSITIDGPVDGLNLKVAEDLNSLRLGDVTEASVHVTDALRTADAWRWVTGSLTAKNAKWIRISGDTATGTPGDIGADVMLTGPGSKSNWRALGGTKIAGTITGGIWRLAGPAKKISAGATAPGWSLNVDGELRNLMTTVGNLSGTIAAGSIHQVDVERDLDNALLMAGLHMGDDGLFGGTGANTDTMLASVIDSLKIGGAMRNTFIGAGWDPVNGTFNDGDDLIVGGASSMVRSITIGGLVESGGVGTGTLPKKLSINGQKLDPQGHTLFFAI